MVSVEFNLIYRWHSCISQRDNKWSKDFYRRLFPGKDIDKLSMDEFVTGVRTWQASIPEDPAHRTIAGFERLPDGHFKDDDLVGILRESIEDHAGAFGARNVPHVLRLVEVLGIEQTRKWRVASLNELREFFGLERHATFEDINPDPVVAQTLRQLYDHPDYVEMYPGIVAEDDKKPMVPGVGIGPTYTISRAILSDAVVSFRFFFFLFPFTTDFRRDTCSFRPLLHSRLHGCKPHQLGHRRSFLEPRCPARLRLLQALPQSVPQPFQVQQHLCYLSPHHPV